MPYLLRFDGANDYVSGDAAAAVETASSLVIEIDAAIPTLQGDTKMYRLGIPGVFILIGPQLDASCRLFIFNGGTVTQAFTSSLSFGVRYLIRAELNFATMTYALKVNGTTAASGAIGGGAISGINRFRAIGAQDGGSGFCQMDLYALREYVNGVQISEYNPSASGGSGTSLIDTLGANNGTLNNFTVPACWVFYSSGGTAYADLLSGATFSSSIGTLASSTAHTDVLNGVSYTSSVNSLNAARGYGDTLSGLTYSASVGQLDATRGYSSLLVGGAYSYTVGNLESTNTSATGRDDALQGINLSFAVGSLVSTVQRNTTLAGLSYTSAVGNLSASLAYNSALLGLTYSASVNTLLHTWSGEVTVTIEGYTIRYADSIVAAAYANDIISAGYAADILERITWQH